MEYRRSLADTVFHFKRKSCVKVVRKVRVGLYYLQSEYKKKLQTFYLRTSMYLPMYFVSRHHISVDTFQCFETHFENLFVKETSVPNQSQVDYRNVTQ